MDRPQVSRPPLKDPELKIKIHSEYVHLSRFALACCHATTFVNSQHSQPFTARVLQPNHWAWLRRFICSGLGARVRVRFHEAAARS